jgi:hypothetical protein
MKTSQSRSAILLHAAALVHASLVPTAVQARHVFTARAAFSRAQSATMAAKLDDLTVYELKAVCRAKGLKVSGKKAELIARVAAAPPGVTASNGVSSSTQSRSRGRGRGSSGSGSSGEIKREPAAPAPPPTAAAAAAATRMATSTNAIVQPTASAVAPARPMPSSAPFAAQLAASVEAEVVGRVEAEELEDEQRRAARRTARRAKLSQYFQEEYISVVGALEQRAGEQFAAAFTAAAFTSATPPSPPPLEARASPTDTSRYILAAYSRGHRLAWCRTFDAAAGTGVLVDLEAKTELRLERSSLRVGGGVPAERCMLHPGEFVEYEPNAAQAHAAGGGDGGEGWVSGILGWPLMCETLNGAVEAVEAVSAR